MPARRTLSAHTKRIVAARAKWRCEACGGLLDEDYEIDHLVPLHLGGTDALDNLQALDGRCHRRKTVREEAARVEARRAAARRRVARPALSCVQCGAVVSPYFSHVCPLSRLPD